MIESPGFDRMIGSIRVTRVEEAVGPFSAPETWFADYDRATLDQHRSWLAPKYLVPSTGRLVSSVHTWVIRTPRQTILVDTCTGNSKDRPGWPDFHMLDLPYLDRLRAAGVDPAEVDVVLCTHLHVDHVGWNTKLENGRWIPTFPNAKYLMSRLDHDYFQAASSRESTSKVTRNTYLDSVLPVVEAGRAVFVDGTEEIAEGLTLMPAPGHTPGQVSLNLRSGGQMACFCGDTLHHPLQVPLWHWKTSVCVDPQQAVETRRSLLEHCVASGALLLPAHFADPHGGTIAYRGGTFALDWL